MSPRDFAFWAKNLRGDLMKSIPFIYLKPEKVPLSDGASPYRTLMIRSTLTPGAFTVIEKKNKKNKRFERSGKRNGSQKH